MNCSRCGHAISESESYQAGDEPGERLHQLDRCFWLVKGELDELKAKSQASAPKPKAPAKKKKSGSKRKR